MSDSTMDISSLPKLSTVDSLKHLTRLAKEYFWDSNQSYRALLLLLGILLGVFGSIALTVVFTEYVSSFFQALAIINVPLFIESTTMILVSIAGFSALKSVTSYLSEVLQADWRQWLTQRLINQFSNDEQYVTVNRESHHLNSIEVTVVSSVKEFVELTLSLGKDLIEKILALPIYLRTLWIVGGALTIVGLGASITIPGYLALAAILFGVLAGVLNHFIGHPLKNWLNKNINSEAKMKNEIGHVNTHSENIALANTINIHQQSLINESQTIRDNSYQIATIKSGLAVYNEFYQPLSYFFPYFVTAPLYFAQKITEGELYGIGYAFGQVQYSLSWFLTSYEQLSKYSASVERIVELENALKNVNQKTHQDIRLQNSDLNTISVEHINIAKTNSSTDYMMRNLNFKLDSKKSTFIRGENGIGKSTLFKVIAGTWKYGNGNVFLPGQHKTYVLPQTALIPPGYTLKQLLDYSDSTETYTQQEYENVLNITGLGEFIPDLLNNKIDWSTLSGGEKQTIAIARVLLKKEKPTLLLLDEATSAMDEKRQTKMYQLLMGLKDTKIISIAHRENVMRFHDEVLDLSVDEEKNANVSIRLTRDVMH